MAADGCARALACTRTVAHERRLAPSEESLVGGGEEQGGCSSAASGGWFESEEQAGRFPSVKCEQGRASLRTSSGNHTGQAHGLGTVAEMRAAAEVFVERRFTHSKLTLKVYRPTRVKQKEYACAYEIRSGRKTLAERRVFGVDGLQAMLLALGLVDIDLDHLVRAVPNGRIDAIERRDLRRLRFPAPGRKR
jgi:hypothetical protein